VCREKNVLDIVDQMGKGDGGCVEVECRVHILHEWVAQRPVALRPALYSTDTRMSVAGHTHVRRWTHACPSLDRDEMIAIGLMGNFCSPKSKLISTFSMLSQGNRH
jgi:hypothetical protein